MPEKANKPLATHKANSPQEATPSSEPSGFKLPPPTDTPPVNPPSQTVTPNQPPNSPVTTTTTATTSPQPLPPDAETAKTDARDWVIAGLVLVVLLVASLFVKNAWANHLVGKKIAPMSANLSGWWLFIGLNSVWVTLILAFVNHDKFLTPLYLIPLGLIGLIAFISALLTNRR